MSLLTGLKAHIWQRISAVFLFLYFPLCISYLMQAEYESYSSFRIHLLTPIFLIPTLVALGLLWVHIWVGVRDVLLDYFPRRGLPIALVLVAIGLFLVIADVIWIIYALWSLVGYG